MFKLTSFMFCIGDFVIIPRGVGSYANCMLSWQCIFIQYWWKNWIIFLDIIRNGRRWIKEHIGVVEIFTKRDDVHVVIIVLVGSRDLSRERLQVMAWWSDKPVCTCMFSTEETSVALVTTNKVCDHVCELGMQCVGRDHLMIINLNTEQQQNRRGCRHVY